MTERPDEDLVAALIKGDESALGVLYDRHADGPLSRHPAPRWVTVNWPRRVLQDTYLALWNRAELFDRRQGSVIGWLSTIARNRSIDRLRALGRRPAPLPLSGMYRASRADEAGADDARDALTRLVHPAQRRDAQRRSGARARYVAGCVRRSSARWPACPITSVG